MVKPPQHLERFKQAEAEIKETLVLTGSYLIVEKAQVVELKTASGIILDGGGSRQASSVEANLPEFVYVLAVGAGHYDEDTDADVPLDTKVGDILLVGRNSVKWFSNLGIQGDKGFTIGITEESEVQMRFRGRDGLERFLKALNQQTQG